MINDVVYSLNSGHVGIFPSDTILGFLAPFSEDAARRLCVLKQRDESKGFVVLISSMEMLDMMCDVTPQNKLFLDRYWPGPVTFILKKKAHVSSLITGGRDTIAVRFPKQGPIVDVLRAVNAPLLSTSVNVSGEPSITKVSDISDSITSSLSFLVDGDGSSVASTIVDLTRGDEPIILRQGVGSLE